MTNISKWLVALSLPAVAFSAQAATESKNGATLTTYNIPDGWLQTLSDNGKWGIWQYPSNDEPDAELSILDVEKGIMVSMPVKPESLEAGAKAVPADITNDGKRVFGSYNGQPGYYDADQQVWDYLPLPRALRKWNGEVDACTPDGKTLIGIVHQAWSVFTSLIWTWNEDTDEYEVTAKYSYPTREDAYNAGLMYAGDWQEYLETGDTDANIRLFQISADGKYAIGGIDHNRNWGNGCFLYDIEKGEWSWLTHQDGDQTYMARSAKMSNDGTWIYANMQGFDMEEDEQEVSGRNFLKNMKTGEVTYPKMLGTVNNIDNFGRFYYSVGRSSVDPTSSLCVDHDGHLVDLHMILSQVYGIDFARVTGNNATGFSMGVSDDGLVLGCNAFPRQAAYTVTLPKTLHESAGDVNVLSNYQYGPAAGSQLAHFKNFTIALSNSASVNEELNASIVDEAGKLVCESLTVTPVNEVNQTFVIGFPEQVFTPGMNYTVVIPEGLFYLPGSKSRNPEVRVTYVGREDGPVKMTRVSPEEGTSVREFNIANPLTLYFNTNLARVSGVYGALYQKGSDTPITQLDGAVSGSVFQIYSPSDYKLKENIEYEIRIPAGMVTDIVGFCPNEEIRVVFKGAYVPKDETGRFSDDFSNPNESLNKWLLYEGDHNTPASSVTQFDFDNDNTPWNFSIRDDNESYDYCAASHSTYNPAGKSDDWMVTPQLLIDNKDIWLSFKTQGFRNNKQDKLKVIVWPCEETYGALNKSIVDRMRSEGTVIFDDRVLPGASEQTLAGDWQTKKFQLDQFVGKQVYIAFVNENENQSMVFVDDVLVEYTGKFIAGVTTESTVVEKNEVVMTAYVTNESDNNVKKISASYKNETTGSTDSFEADVDLAKGERYVFSFSKPMSLEYGVENKYTVSIDVDGDKQTLSGLIKNLKYDFPKKVLVEEITGAWCGNCPQGTLAFDYLESMYPGQIIPVAIHNGDPYAFSAYETFIELNGYPSGKVNRGAEVLSPMWSGQFSSADRDKTWYDYVSRELESPAELKIEIEQADYCIESDMYEIKWNVEYALNKNNMNYNVFAVMLEDELPTVQTNYFSNIADPIYGDWGQGGKYGQATVLCNANHVARGIAGTSFYGKNGLLPASGIVDQPVSGWIAMEVPTLRHTDETTKENKKISIACVIIDNATGAAITGDIIHSVGVKEHTGAKEIAADGIEAEILITVTDGTVYANGNDRNVEVYTLDGQRVANEGLKGFYIVRAFDENGNSKVAKFVVR